MANRYPLVIDTTNGNNFAELPEGDNLLLTNSSIVNALNISAVGNIAAGTLEVNGVSVTGDYNDLQNLPDIPETLTDLGIADGLAGYILQANGDGTFSFVSRQAANVGNFEFTDNVMTVTAGNTEIASPTNILLNPTDNVVLSNGTKLVFKGSAPDEFDASLQFDTVTANRDILVPDEDGTIATREWVNSQNFGTVTVDWTNIQNTPTTLVGYGITDAATSAQGALADTALQPNTAFDVKGSVFGDDSTLLVDAVNSTINWNVISGAPVFATETFVNNAVAGLVDTAPETLNTLNELAAALGDDPNFATTISTQLGQKVDSISLTAVAYSGSYNDLTDTPTIPSSLTDLGILDSGVNGDVLTTDGSGNFSFTTISTAGGLQNIFSSISTDSGSVNATSANTIVTLAGGTNIATSAVGSTITIDFNGTIPTDVSDLTDNTNVIPTNLENLGNVVIGIANDGDVLVYDQANDQWTSAAPSGGSGATALTELTDVDTTGVRDGDVLTYDLSNSQWISATPSGGGATTLGALIDVDVTGVQDGNGIFYDSQSGNWVAGAASGGGSGIGSRQTFNVTTPSLLDNDSSTVQINIGFPGYILYKVETDAAAWIRFYTDDNIRSIDTIRPIDEDPINVTGLIAEIVTAGADVVKMAPGVIGFNDDSPVANNIPITVTNLSGTTRTITVTVTVVQIEA